MKRKLLLAGLAVMITVAAGADTRVRKCVANGPMYPEKMDDVVKALNRFYGNVTYSPPNQKLIACVVPHSAWGFCGQIDAAALKELEMGQYERVIVLAPSHQLGFEGLSIPAVEAFTIPLGLIPLDGKAIGTLNYSALITLRGVSYTNKRRPPLHETETSVENVLPFLLERMGPFFLVPILTGDLKDLDGHLSATRIEAVAETLKGIIDDKTLIVVSTDFTHFGNDFSFRPFNQNVSENIEKLDREAFRLVLARDFDGFIKYLEKTNNPICGQVGLLILMKLLPENAQGQLIDYVQSMTKTKDENRSVSYAAINFYDPTKAPLPAQKHIAPAGSDITGVTTFPEPAAPAAPSVEAKPLDARPTPK